MNWIIIQKKVIYPRDRRTFRTGFLRQQERGSSFDFSLLHVQMGQLPGISSRSGGCRAMSRSRCGWEYSGVFHEPVTELPQQPGKEAPLFEVVDPFSDIPPTPRQVSSSPQFSFSRMLRKHQCQISFDTHRVVPKICPGLMQISGRSN